jgi:hypothetical protein
MWFDFGGAALVNSISLLGGRPMVRHQTLDLAIGVRVPASQPTFSPAKTKQQFTATTDS